MDTIPAVIRIRPISLRAFVEDGEMIDADLVNGEAIVPLIERFFSNPDVAYLQEHYAKLGCYAARIVCAQLSHWDRGMEMPAAGSLY